VDGKEKSSVGSDLSDKYRIYVYNYSDIIEYLEDYNFSKNSYYIDPEILIKKEV